VVDRPWNRHNHGTEVVLGYLLDVERRSLRTDTLCRNTTAKRCLPGTWHRKPCTWCAFAKCCARLCVEDPQLVGTGLRSKALAGLEWPDLW